MSIKVWPFKDPNEVLDYMVDWTNRLAAGDTINTSAWTITVAPDNSLVINSNSIANPVTIVWLQGGTLGQKYTVQNKVTTAQGRTMEQSATLKINTK